MTKPNWRTGKVGISQSTSAPSAAPAEPPTTTIVSRAPALNLSTALREPINATATSHMPPSEGFSTNPHESTACVFFEVCAEFATACSEVWPSDEFMKKEAARLEVLGKSFASKQEEGLKLAKAFHLAFVDHYPDVVSKKPEFFSLPNQILLSVNAANKFQSSPQDVRDTVWEYLRSLVQYAGMVDMYSKCPQAMLDSISGVAGGLIAKLQAGELDPNNLNPLQLGQMMMQEMSAEDLEGFGNAIMEGGNMDSMMSIMQSTMGGIGGGGGAFPASMMGGLGGAGGMPDISMLSELFRKK
jgi:hypothetical protein